MKNMYERTFAFFGEYGVSIAMDTQNHAESWKVLTLAIAFCDKYDTFNKFDAKDILNKRLDARIDDSGFAIQSPFTFQVKYEGNEPRNDIFKKIISVLHDTNCNVYKITLKNGYIALGQIILEENKTITVDTGTVFIPIERSNIISKKLLSIRRNVNRINRDIRKTIKSTIKQRIKVLV